MNGLDKVLNRIAERIHATAVQHGWWDCPHCYGRETVSFAATEHVYEVDCPACEGSGKFRNVGELLALVHSEVSEALEAMRKPELDALCDKCEPSGYEPLDIQTRRSCPKCGGSGEALGGSRFAEELADVVIRVLDIAAAYDIDLGAVITEKMAYNENRPHKHGGKRF